ncbi:MAG: hypothetical protein AAF602_21045 [Myxococcota bacterium]
MVQLRYRWGEHETQDAVTPIRAPTLALHVADRECWEDDVTDLIAEWARCCALRVVYLWRCPEPTRRFLETGNEALRDEAHRLARRCEYEARRDPGGVPGDRAEWQAVRAAVFATSGGEPMVWLDHGRSGSAALEAVHEQSVHTGYQDWLLRRARQQPPASSGMPRSLLELAGDVVRRFTRPPSVEDVSFQAGHTLAFMGPMAGWLQAGEVAREIEAGVQVDYLRRQVLERALPERLWGLVEREEGVLCDALLSGLATPRGR